MSATREVREDQHGTATGYVYGCRCQDCRNADLWAERARHRRGLEPDDPRHGTVNGYVTWGCRCEDCANAKSADNNERSITPPPPGVATIAELRMWARGLGFSVNQSMSGRSGQALVDRWNRENPDRPFVRGGAS